MPVTNTSKESYEKMRSEKLGPQQQLVFDAFKALEPASDRDVSKHLGIQVNQINGRRGELVDYGFIVEHGRKYDYETKRNVISWVTANPMAQRQLEKTVGKTKNEQKEINPNMKYLLKLKNGQRFTITAAMKEEIEEAMSAKRGSKTITLANQVFVLTNIALPITEFGNAPAAQPAPIKEESRDQTLIEKDGSWQVTTISESQLRRDRIVFRTQRIGVTSGTIKQDLMTLYDGPYESVRDMLRSGQ